MLRPYCVTSRKEKGIPCCRKGNARMVPRKKRGQKTWTASRMETIQLQTLWKFAFGMMRFPAPF